MFDTTTLVTGAYLTEDDKAVLAGMPQTVLVMNHLVRFGSISGMEAREYYGITRLPAVIYILKYKYDPPVRIRKETENGKNRFGKETHWARYYYVEE